MSRGFKLTVVTIGLGTLVVASGLLGYHFAQAEAELVTIEECIQCAQAGIDYYRALTGCGGPVE